MSEREQFLEEVDFGPPEGEKFRSESIQRLGYFAELRLNPETRVQAEQLRDFGQMQTKLRRYLGLSIPEVADSLGSHPAVIAFLEAGLVEPVELRPGFVDRLTHFFLDGLWDKICRNHGLDPRSVPRPWIE